MPDVDFTKCDQPDELLQLAWNAGLDKKALIREGVDAAGLLLAGERNELVTLFWPVPRPLEAVDRWSENPGPSTGIPETLRPFASAVVPGCVLGFVITRLFTTFGSWQDSSLSALVWIIVASIVVLGLVFKVLIAATLRRRVARLDEERALEIVLEQLRLGMIKNPALAPRALTWIRREVVALASAQPKA